MTTEQQRPNSSRRKDAAVRAKKRSPTGLRDARVAFARALRLNGAAATTEVAAAMADFENAIRAVVLDDIQLAIDAGVEHHTREKREPS